jgi:hypothetical protein
MLPTRALREATTAGLSLRSRQHRKIIARYSQQPLAADGTYVTHQQGIKLNILIQTTAQRLDCLCGTYSLAPETEAALVRNGENALATKIGPNALTLKFCMRFSAVTLDSAVSGPAHELVSNMHSNRFPETGITA